ncbi:MAG: hypothetical protein ACJASC_000165 [Limimaricola cinnabarinus]
MNRLAPPDQKGELSNHKDLPHMFRPLTLSGALLLLAGSASAQDIDGAAVGFGISTLGGYASASYEAMPTLRARGLLTGIPGQSFSEEGDDVDYDIDLSVGGIAALADYYPNQTGLRLSGGLFFSNTDIVGAARATGAETIEVGDNEYSNASIETELTFENNVAPMLAVGYEKRFGRGWAFDAEIGAIVVGGINVDVDGENVPMRDLEIEAQQLEDNLSAVKAYPWLALGVSYRF